VATRLSFSSSRSVQPARPQRGKAWVVLLLVLAGIAILVVGGAALVIGGGDEETNDPLLYTVASGPFTHEVVDWGEVESAKNVEIRCEVKARNASSGISTSIIWVAPEGTHVEEGDVVVRLDKSTLENEEIQQQIVVNSSEALMIQAKNVWESAVITKTEYLEGTYKQEAQAAQGEIFVAEENVRRAEEYVRYSEKLAARSYVTSIQLEGDRFAVDKARTELDAAQTKLSVLTDFTLGKMEKELDSAIKIGEAQYNAQRSSYELELRKLKETRDQITKCTIAAPRSGQVIHANVQSSRSTQEFIVEEGALVRERQPIVRIPDPTSMQIKAEINESRVALIKPGMPATITIDAFDNLELAGEVVRVNEYPEPPNWYNSTIKNYRTYIRLKDGAAKVRPGLTAKIRIQVNHLDDVLQVPVGAVHVHVGRYFCVARAAGTWKLREVMVGASNDKFVVIKTGLEQTDRVSLTPRRFLAGLDLPDAPNEDEQQIIATDSGSTDSSTTAQTATSTTPTSSGAAQ